MEKKFKDWSSVKDRFDEQIVAQIAPNFQLSSKSTIVTIGSCFARNIEEHLSLIGVNLPTYEFKAPYRESSNRPNGVLNKFTPSAIREELKWAIDIINGKESFETSTEKFKFITKSGDVIDLQLNYAPVSLERFFHRRRELLAIYEQLKIASCVTITLGLVERWVDTTSNLSVFGAPNSKELLREKGRFKFQPMNFNESLSEVEEIVSLLRSINNDVKILITTSPVPLNKTFKDSDVLVANSYSKSVLRAVCGEIDEKYDFVDYFPSFEMVTYRDPSKAFGDDLRHVNDFVVGDVVQLLVDNYFSDADEFDRACRIALGDLTAKRSHTKAMNFILEHYAEYTLNSSKLLILSRVANRCGKSSEAKQFITKYFSIATPDPRDLKALNFIAVKYKLHDELKDYCAEILAMDPSNERAEKMRKSVM